MPLFCFGHTVAVIFATVSLSPVSDQFDRYSGLRHLGGEQAFTH